MEAIGRQPDDHGLTFECVSQCVWRQYHPGMEKHDKRTMLAPQGGTCPLNDPLSFSFYTAMQRYHHT